MMKMMVATFLAVLLLDSGVSAQEAWTLEKIMQHPRWIGMWAESVAFAPDGNSIFYLAHADPRGYRVVEVDERGNVLEVHNTIEMPGVGDRRAGKTLFSFKGDLYFSDPERRRLTQTERREADCRWLDDNRFVYRADDGYFVQDLRTGTERQLANLLFEDDTKAGDDFRSKQQDRLFPIIKEREEQQEAQSRESGIPRFFLGDGRELVRMEVTNDEGKALLVHAAKVETQRDLMPIYLNRSGEVSTQVLRTKVGAEASKDHRLALLNLRNEELVELSLMELPGYKADVPLVVEDVQWSHNGRLALTLLSSNYKERWLAEVDFEKAKLVVVDHLHDEAWETWEFKEFDWTLDGQSLWYQSEETGYAHLYLWNGETTKQLTQGAFEVSNIHPAPDNRNFYFRANKNNSGRYDVFKVNLEGQISPVTRLGGQTQFDLSPDGRSLVLLHSRTATPPEIFLQDSAGVTPPKQITKLASSDFLQEEWTLPQFVDVPSSHHSRPIRAKLYSPPKGVESSGAAVVFVHGAGYLQNADEGWSYYFREFMFHTFLSRRGVTVLDMDYRASAGYGRDWRTAIYRQMGTPELEDLKDGVTYLVEEHGIDPLRVGVYGGSYGGFLTLMALFKEPDLFACGAALRPVTDWAQYEHEYTARILNTPDEDPEAYLRSSPIEFAEGLSKPLLLCHGMLDDNVVAQDTVRLTQRLIQLKKENWETALYPLEPHGFVEPESWLDEYRRIWKLFEANLGLQAVR